jgi:hypothetical protein
LPYFGLRETNSLSDKALGGTLYDSHAMRDFVGIDLGIVSVEVVQPLDHLAQRLFITIIQPAAVP